jgi:hypothetical protein
VKWGIFATSYNVVVGSDAVHTLYATKPESTIGTPVTSYKLGSAATQSQAAAKIYSFGGSYAQSVATGNSTVGTIQDSSINNDFAQWQSAPNGANSFGYFNGALGDFTNGTAGTALDLFRMPTGSSSSFGTYEGTFTINNAGAIRFSNLAAVPEPGTVALLVAAAGVIVFLRRRTAKNIGV